MKGNEASYVIPLRKVFNAPKTKRARRAVQEVRNFSRRHAKVDDVIVSEEVNEKIWKHSLNIPRRIEVILRKEGEGKVVVYWKEGMQLGELKRKEAEEAKKKKEKAEKKKAEKKPKEEEEGEATELKKKLEEKRKREQSAEKAAIKRKTSRK